MTLHRVTGPSLRLVKVINKDLKTPVVCKGLCISLQVPVLCQYIFLVHVTHYMYF